MISVSMLSSCLYCPRKLYFNYVLGISGMQKKEAVSGRIKHHVIEYVNNMEREIVSRISEGMMPDDIESLYRTNYHRILLFVTDRHEKEIESLGQKKQEAFAEVWPSLLEEARLRAANVIAFVASNPVYGHELWMKLTPKYLSEFCVSSKALDLIGKIDKIEQHSSGINIPLEIKSGKAPPEGLWPGHMMQLAAYIMLLKEINSGVDHGYVEYIDIKERRKLVLNPFIEDKVRELIASIKSLLSASEPPPVIGHAAKCAKCEIRAQCMKKE